MWVKVSIVFCLLVLFYQDMRYRLVYAMLFPVLMVLYLFYAYQHNFWTDVLSRIALNFSFLFIQFLLLILYFSLKSRKWVCLTQDYLGWGDILFLASLAFYLSPLNYLLFYVLSLFLILVYSLILSGGRATNARIPLAGLQALLFLLVLLLEWQSHLFSLQSDQWILNRIIQ